MKRKLEEREACGIARLAASRKLDTLRIGLEGVGGDDLFQLIVEGIGAFEAGDREACGEKVKAAAQLCWEKLHTGTWSCVDVAWRDAYAASQLVLAQMGRGEGHCLGHLDLALLMGGPLFREDVFLEAERCCARPAKRKAEGDPGGDAARAMKLEPSLGLLPPKSLVDMTIPKVDRPSLENFLLEYFLKETPVVIRGGIAHWPAVEKWQDLSYLKRLAGSRTVPVEIGTNYLRESWSQRLMKMADFIDSFVSSSGDADAKQIGYLAQHELFEQIPSLMRDIAVPDYCSLGKGKVESVNAWFGPARTTSPFHHDPHHNILAQVVGWKYLRIAAPSESEHLYPYVEGMHKNASQLDVDSPDYDRFPLYRKLKFKECILRPGEMIYIPPKWWHFVRSLSLSFSVSFWWS